MAANTTTGDIDEGGDPPGRAHLVAADDAPVTDEVLARAVRGLADAVLVADADGSIVFWNAAAERLFGWSAAEAEGRTLDLIVPERLRTRHWDGWRRVVSTGQTSYGERLLEVPALHRDGRQLSIAFTVSLLTPAGGAGVTGVVAVVRDDTERWQQRREQRDEIARLRADPRLAEPAT
jgi:PAS domain S-box-containing protein